MPLIFACAPCLHRTCICGPTGSTLADVPLTQPVLILLHSFDSSSLEWRRLYPLLCSTPFSQPALPHFLSTHHHAASSLRAHMASPVLCPYRQQFGACARCGPGGLECLQAVRGGDERTLHMRTPCIHHALATCRWAGGSLAIHSGSRQVVSDQGPRAGHRGGLLCVWPPISHALSQLAALCPAGPHFAFDSCVETRALGSSENVGGVIGGCAECPVCRSYLARLSLSWSHGQCKWGFLLPTLKSTSLQGTANGSEPWLIWASQACHI